MSPLSRTQGPSSSTSRSQASLLRLTPEHLKLRLRLLPLLQIEEVLIRKLTPAGSPEYEATLLAQITNIPGAGLRGKEKELTINSQIAWKGLFGKLGSGPTRESSFDEGDGIDWDDPDVSPISVTDRGVP